MTRLTFLPEPFVRIALGRRSDLGAYVIAGIVNERARLWKINADDSDGGEITFTSGDGKDDSLDVAILDDGSVFLVISEAAGQGASGSTSEPATYRIAGVFPAKAGGACIDQPARNQANAATSMAHTALAQIEALAARVTAIEDV